MVRKSAAILLGIVFSSLFLLGATPLQQSPLSVIPWWGWLVIISVVLLIMFIIVMRLDWRSAAHQQDDEE